VSLKRLLEPIAADSRMTKAPPLDVEIFDIITIEYVSETSRPPFD